MIKHSEVLKMAENKLSFEIKAKKPLRTDAVYDMCQVVLQRNSDNDEPYVFVSPAECFFLVQYIQNENQNPLALGIILLMVCFFFSLAIGSYSPEQVGDLYYATVVAFVIFFVMYSIKFFNESKRYIKKRKVFKDMFKVYDTKLSFSYFFKREILVQVVKELNNR